MSRYDYQASKDISAQSYPFYALVMALYRQADTSNQHLIQYCWPEVVAELKARYNAPGGWLDSEVSAP